MAQLQTTTGMNRYPGVFQTVQHHCAKEMARKTPRILSFGCSHGEELMSLRSYFPTAALFGCDVNSDALNDAARITGCTIFRSTPEAIRAFGPYDVIFAMSVLCRFSKSQTALSLIKIFPYSEFQDHVGLLDSVLSDGGLFCIHNANYLFSQTALYSRYTPVRSPLIGENGFVDKWTSDDVRITRIEKYEHGREHVVASRPDFLTDDDFRDVVFKKGHYDPPQIEGRLEPNGKVISASEMGADLCAAIEGHRIATRIKTEVVEEEAGATWIGKTWSKSTLNGTVAIQPTWWTEVHREDAGLYTPAQKRWLIKPQGKVQKSKKSLLRRWLSI